MTEFENLKRSYASVLQYGMIMGANKSEAKQGNEIVHKFCETLVENSMYSDNDKNYMKNELQLLKQELDDEIEAAYNKRQ